MKWLKRKLANWLLNDNVEDVADMPSVLGSNRKTKRGIYQTTSSTRELNSSGMQFTMHKANGGIVIECREYDHVRDNNEYSLHIITSDQDLGEQLSHILTYQQLKK